MLDYALPSLVDPDDVTAIGGSAANAEEAAQVVSALARSYMRQTITLVTDDTIVVPGTRQRRLILGERPLLAVSEVTLDARAVTDYRAMRRGYLWRSAGWGDADREVVVTCDHGYAVVPDDLRAACCTAAVRLADNVGALRSLGVDGEVSMTYALPAGFTPAELTVLDRYRRRTFA